MRHLILSMTTILVVVCLNGCKGHQDVRPLLQTAKASFEEAAHLETRALDLEVRYQREQSERLFATIHDGVRRSLLILIYTQWDSENQEFRSGQHEHVLRVFAGVPSEGTLSDDHAKEVTRVRERLKAFLSRRFTFPAADDGGTGITLSAFDMMVVHRGSAAAAAQRVMPTASIAVIAQLQMEYDDWYSEFHNVVIEHSGAIRAVTAARTEHMNALKHQGVRRLERLRIVYQSLADITQMMHDSVGALTDHAAIITIANSLARIAGRLVGSARVADDTARPDMTH